MGSNQLWESVAKTSTGFKCVVCSQQYDGNLTTYMWHLARIEGHGIDICPSVSENVQKEAYSYLIAATIPIRKRASSSSDEFSSSKRLNPTNVVNEISSSSSIQAQSYNAPIGDRLWMTEPFKKYVNDLWCCLMDDNVSKVGIRGVGGVGKTEVAKYIHSYLLQVPSMFRHAFWVNVSQDHSIHKLQTLVSNVVGVDLSDEDDETERAARLLKVLAEKEKFVLFIDDVWDYFSLQELGIPLGANQCTVVITTRSLQVCRKFDCKRRIDIECLKPEESYDLYMKVLGDETKLSKLGKVVSKSIANKCGGLPLAITITARNMRGISDVRQMRNAMNGHMQKKVDLEIFQKLKLSFDHLKDPTLQHCFLCCPLFVEEFYTTLMGFLVDEGIIKRMKSRREELENAFTMVKKLQDMRLLEIDEDDCVQMNAMIQKMARHIMEENQQRAMILRGDISLGKLPNVESWTEDLVRVSLTRSEEIENIPLNYSPSCSKLSTLLLSRNWSLSYIEDSFFVEFPRLKVLCLSETSIESLPISVYGLRNLTTLLLFECTNLREIPLIAKLSNLEKLDLSYSGVEKVPDDIKMLSKLKHLNLYESQVKDFKCKILAKLSNLQFLCLSWSSPVKAEEITYLRRLESLTCHFIDFIELNNFLMSLKEREFPLQLCVQAAGGHDVRYRYDFGFFYDSSNILYNDTNQNNEWSTLSLHECNNVNGLVLDLQHNIPFKQIAVVKCNEARSFCTFSPINNAVELASFSVKECDGIEFLFSVSLVAKGKLDKLKNIWLFKLKHFSTLFSCENDNCFLSVLPRYGNCFLHLRSFRIQECPSIKQLFPLDLLPNLKNLEEIDVSNCALMEEIFATKVGEQQNIFRLPKLYLFRLKNLPELKSICTVQIICDALLRFDFERCPKLIMDHVQVYCTRQSLERVSLCEL